MSFFSARALAPQPEQVQVPAHTWACRAQPGPVGAGFVGLRLGQGGQLQQVATAGQQLAAGKGKQQAEPLWWLRAERWTLSFAPQPELAPEAGLALEIEPFATAGDYGLLASWLQLLTADVTVDTLAGPLREHPCVKTLPPCAPQALLAQRCRQLHAYAVGAFGLRVLAMRRVDLPAPPHQLLPAPPPAPAPQGTAMGKALPGATPAAARGATRPDAATAHWPELVARDQRACQRLGRELPLLDQRLRARWGASGWCQHDMAVFAQQRRLSQQLGLLASKLGRPASVAQRFAPGHGPGEAQRRLVAGAALRAEQALGECWAVLEVLPDGQVPTATQLRALDATVARLAHEVNRRLRAWWELEP